MRIAIATLFLLISQALGAAQTVQVDGYYRKDGTYVAPHYRTAPDSNPYNNWSTRGNVNPYTGQSGTVNPYPQPYTPSPLYGTPSRKSGYR